MGRKTDELAKSSPVDIPGDATVKVQHKAGGYDQISYKWSDGTYKYEARWHTTTPNAPEESPNSWVVERTKPGTPTGQMKVQSIHTPEINNDWTPKWEWGAVVDAYNKGTTTPLKDAILNSGHVNAP